MTGTLEMLQAQPKPPKPEQLGRVAAFVDSAFACAQACTSCASIGLAGPDSAELADCIAACLDCADLCAATARILSRPQSGAPRESLVALIEACAGMCEMSARECFRHELHHQHCALCKIACRECLDACEKLLEVL
jgi:hypothetical protein